jgi:opine dehydrogenase
VRQVFKTSGAQVPPIVEFSTLTYIARKKDPVTVNVTGVAKAVRAAALPDHQHAIGIARQLYPNIDPVDDLLFSSLANANLVLHPPGAILGAAWVEATGGDFTFYVDGMTPGVAKVMSALDAERCAVGRAFGHELPDLVGEMHSIGSVEDKQKTAPLLEAVSGGEANRNIKAPDSFDHRYYREDFGHGLLPFVEFATIAKVAVPAARALLEIGRLLIGDALQENVRSAEAMGIAGMELAGLKQLVGGGGGH